MDNVILYDEAVNARIAEIETALDSGLRALLIYLPSKFRKGCKSSSTGVWSSNTDGYKDLFIKINHALIRKNKTIRRHPAYAIDTSDQLEAMMNQPIPERDWDLVDKIVHLSFIIGIPYGAEKAKRRHPNVLVQLTLPSNVEKELAFIMSVTRDTCFLIWNTKYGPCWHSEAIKPWITLVMNQLGNPIGPEGLVLTLVRQWISQEEEKESSEVDEILTLFNSTLKEKKI